MSDTANRPTEVDEIIRNVRSGVDYGSMGTIRALLDYIAALEERNRNLEAEYHNVVQTAIDLVVAFGGADGLQAEFDAKGIGHLLIDEAAQQGGEEHG